MTSEVGVSFQTKVRLTLDLPGWGLRSGSERRGWNLPMRRPILTNNQHRNYLTKGGYIEAL